ncbi:MAG TPA: hypothetical protein VGN32_05485 [Ktedonobacterales bacterium]|nr:hypothetical protein [Ktedonobacterales bacterium]
MGSIALETSAQRPFMAFIRCTGDPRDTGYVGDARAAREWLPLCYRLTPRLERLGDAAALLDLGTRSPDEARAWLEQMLARCASQHIPARAGIGPSGTLAQLALLCAPANERLALVSGAAAAAFPRSVPVRLLRELAPAGLIAAEVVARLEGYGLRTLGHLARLGEEPLRRQFGSRVGAMLAVLCRGEDLHPLHPTAPAHWHRARLRLCPAVAADQVLLALPHLVRRALPLLAGHQAQALRLGVCWESGEHQRQSVVLREHTADPQRLIPAAQRLLLALLCARARDARPGMVAEVWLALGACVPGTPEQIAIWRTRRQRRLTVQSLADCLTRRHGRPLVLQPQLVAAEAIFAEERYRLIPTGTEEGGVEGAQSATPPPAAMRREDAPHGPAVASAWDQVPQRLHWW